MPTSPAAVNKTITVCIVKISAYCLTNGKQRHRRPKTILSESVVGRLFDTKLEIPQARVEIFESVPKKATIRTQKGSWAVTVKKKCRKPGDNYSFYLQGRGWVDLVKHNGLRKGDILVFSLLGLSQFHLFVFGKTSCLKKLKTGSRLKITRKKNVNRFAQFEVALKKFNLFGLNVPPDFVGRTGMQKRKKVMVKDCEGREWPVKVRSERNGGLVLGDGWGDFVKQSGLKVGITCLIQSAIQDNDADDNVLLVNVVETI